MQSNLPHKESERYQIILKLLSENSENNELCFAGHLLARTAAKYPDRIALIVAPDTALSYSELFKRASIISAIIREKGLQPRDKILLCIENSTFFYEAYYGCWQMGIIVIPLNTFLHTEEIAHIITDAQPQLIIVSDALAEKLAPIAPLPPMLTESELHALQHTVRESPPLYALSADEPAILLYTSGTTGVPKGVALSSRAIISNIAQGVSRFDFVAHERILCPLPLFHSFTQNTCVWSSIACGVTVILVPKITRTNLVEAIKHNPTFVLAIPALYGIFCRLKGISFSDVRYFICGGEALPTNIRRYFALKFGRIIANGYGLTETSPVISVDLEYYWKTTHNIGLPVSDIRYELRDGNPIGTLWVSGPNLMLGYYNAPDATEKVLQHGWLNTGDLACIAEDGSIVICGREKDLIIQRGIKIYPQEIETTLTTHSSVLIAAVIGIADTDGEYPEAYVQLVEGSKTTGEELQTYCKQRLAPYKVPHHVHIITQIPMTPTGKIDKKKLRQLAKDSEITRQLF